MGKVPTRLTPFFKELARSLPSFLSCDCSFARSCVILQFRPFLPSGFWSPAWPCLPPFWLIASTYACALVIADAQFLHIRENKRLVDGLPDERGTKVLIYAVDHIWPKYTNMFPSLRRQVFGRPRHCEKSLTTRAICTIISTTRAIANVY